MTMNESYSVSSLADYMDKIVEFSRGDILWYRGHADTHFTLLPTAYRNTVMDFGEKNSNSVHLSESMRMQQYYAKNYMFIKENGVNATEWLGSAQHYQIRTRFLDWSTSAIHSLIFALEKYFDPLAENVKGIPCVWLLKPQKMNKRIAESILETLDFHKRDTKLREKRKLPDAFWELLADKKDDNRYLFLSDNPQNGRQHMDYIYNLAYFERYLDLARMDFDRAFSEHKINPLFYIMARAYIEGDCFGNEMLKSTPLAVIHPLNSNRIQMQNGVFTVFPFPDEHLYKNNKKDDGSVDYMCMEYNGKICGTLGKIELREPERISRELRTIGVRRSWLYFEQEQISREIESGL